MKTESHNNHQLSHHQLAVHLHGYLVDRYRGVLWVVIVYADITGWNVHAVKGSHYHLFHYYGHNIVVSKIANPASTEAPENIEEKFNETFSPVREEDCHDLLNPENYKINARPTVEATWEKLQDKEGIQPLMLLVYRGETDGSVVASVNKRVYHQEIEGGLAVLLALAE